MPWLRKATAVFDARKGLRVGFVYANRILPHFRFPVFSRPRVSEVAEVLWAAGFEYLLACVSYSHVQRQWCS